MCLICSVICKYFLFRLAQREAITKSVQRFRRRKSPVVCNACIKDVDHGPYLLTFPNVLCLKDFVNLKVTQLLLC